MEFSPVFAVRMSQIVEAQPTADMRPEKSPSFDRLWLPPVVKDVLDWIAT